MSREVIILPKVLIKNHESALAPEVVSEQVATTYETIFSNLNERDEISFSASLPEGWSKKENGHSACFSLYDEFNNQRMRVFTSIDARTGPDLKRSVAFLYDSVFASIESIGDWTPSDKTDIRRYDAIKLNVKGDEIITQENIPHATWVRNVNTDQTFECEVAVEARKRVEQELNDGIGVILDRHFPDRANPQSEDWKLNITDRVAKTLMQLEKGIANTKTMYPELVKQMNAFQFS